VALLTRLNRQLSRAAQPYRPRVPNRNPNKETTMPDTDLDARAFVTTTYIKKMDLRREGPRRLVIRDVLQVDVNRPGQAPKKELVLEFADGTRLGLRAATNTRRLIEAYGPKTGGWINREVILYYSPDVVNPSGGEPGGIRLRFPEAGTDTARPPADAAPFVLDDRSF
jgi:hypothetical protein